LQAEGGRYIRMALILKLLSEKGEDAVVRTGEENPNLVCKNHRCIISERGVKKLFSGTKCLYCDAEAKKI
jgi:aspartate carbamoyltransferase regulatory subunit